MSSLEEQIAARFKCVKCKNRSGNIRRFAATGTGISRFIDWQTNSYLSVSCDRCGYTELYDPRVFEKEDKVTKILDLLFGIGD